MLETIKFCSVLLLNRLQFVNVTSHITTCGDQHADTCNIPYSWKCWHVTKFGGWQN